MDYGLWIRSNRTPITHAHIPFSCLMLKNLMDFELADRVTLLNILLDKLERLLRYEMASSMVCAPSINDREEGDVLRSEKDGVRSVCGAAIGGGANELLMSLTDSIRSRSFKRGAFLFGSWCLINTGSMFNYSLLLFRWRQVRACSFRLERCLPDKRSKQKS